MRVVGMKSISPGIILGNTWKPGYQTTFNGIPEVIIQQNSNGLTAEIQFTISITKSEIIEGVQQFSVKGDKNGFANIKQPICGAATGIGAIILALDGLSHEFSLSYGEKVLYNFKLRSSVSAYNTQVANNQTTISNGSGMQISPYDELVPEGSRADTSKILWLKDLCEGFLERRLPIADSLEQLLNDDPSKASRSIIRLTKQALRNFQKYCRYKQEGVVKFTNDKYQFRYNYPEYYLGTVSELELVPTAIAAVGTVYHATTANYYQYVQPVLCMAADTVNVRSFCEWPIYIKMANDGEFTEDSHIYGMTDIEKDWFINEFDLVMLKAIRSRTHLINLPFSVDFLAVDSDIQDLQMTVEEQQVECSDHTWGWI